MLPFISPSMLGSGHPGYVVSSTYSGPESTTNALLPARLTGDILILASFRRNSALPADIPSGFTNLFSNYNQSNISITFSYRIVSANSAQNSIVVPNSTGNSVLLLRKCKGIGNFNAPNAVAGGNTASHVLPALTLSKPKGIVIGVFHIQTPNPGNDVSVTVPAGLIGYSNNSFLVKRNSTKQFPATNFTTSPSSLRLEATVEVY